MLPLPLAGSFVASALIAASTLAAPIEQSISSSRQFIVYGTDVEARGAICDFAERTKRELLSLLDERDDWKTTIVINAQYPQANTPEVPRFRVDVGQTGFGLKLQVDLVVSSRASRPDIRREILRALLLEMMYRAQPNLSVGTTYASPPDWLLHGVPSAESDFSRDRVTSVLRLSGAAKAIRPLEKFLAERPELLDAAGRTVYGACAFALVDMLRGAPDGRRRLAGFVAGLPAGSDDPMSELRKHFPDVLAPEVAEKNWTQEIVRLSMGQPYQLLGTAETERLLAEKLQLKISDRGVEKSYELEQFPVFLKSGSAKRVLGSLADDLSALATQANPVYAPIVVEYAEIAARLLRGKTGAIQKRLERLRFARENVTTQMRQIDDYMNWFEATNLAGPSGEFAGYLHAAERAGQPELTKRDPISIYLDVLETEFEN